MKQPVARTLLKLGLSPIILHEQPNEGKTIIEKSLRSTVKKGQITEDEKTEGLAHWTNAQLLWDKVAASGIEGEERRKDLYRVRFMLDYLHGTVSKQASPISTADVGSKFDAVAMRTQFAF